MDVGTRPKALIYSRVSSKEQSEGYSVDSQAFRLNKEVPEKGYEVVLEVVDVGYERETLFRPGLSEILERVKEGDITTVWATRRDRFGAGPYPQMFADELARYGCSLKSLDGGEHGEHGEFFDGIKDLMSREELRELARRSMAGRMQKARNGKIVSNGRPNYGFRHNDAGDAYVVFEPEMHTIRRIFSLIGEDGLTLTAVVKRFFREGIPAPNGGERWHHNTVRKYILDDVYYPYSIEELAGVVTPGVLSSLDPARFYGLWWYGRWSKKGRRVSVEKKVTTRRAKPASEWVGVPVPHSGVPKDVADSARKRVSERGVSYSRADKRVWQLTGGVLHCGECGRTMVTNTSYSTRKDGKPVYTYRCKGRRILGEARCVFSKTPSAGKLEGEVWTKVAGALTDPRRLSAGSENPPGPHTLLPSPERLLEQKRAAERKRAGYLDLAATGRMPYSELDGKLAVVEKEIASADGEYRKALDVSSRRKERERTLEEFASRVRGLTVEDFFALDAERRMKVYATLGIQVFVHQDGQVHIEGIPGESLEFRRS